MPADGGVQDCSANLNDPDKPVLEEISTRLAVQTSLLSKIETKQTAQKVLSDGNVKHTETRYGEPQIFRSLHEVLNRRGRHFFR